MSAKANWRIMVHIFLGTERRMRMNLNNNYLLLDLLLPTPVPLCLLKLFFSSLGAHYRKLNSPVDITPCLQKPIDALWYTSSWVQKGGCGWNLKITLYYWVCCCRLLLRGAILNYFLNPLGIIRCTSLHQSILRYVCYNPAHYVQSWMHKNWKDLFYDWVL